MKLFEVLTGRMGESYERCYAWCGSAERARELFGRKNPDIPVRGVFELMDGGDREFVTDLDDAGWESSKRGL